MALTKITSRILDSSGVTILGTIATGVWQGTAINQTYLVGQSGTNTGDETLARINALDVTELGTISSGVWQGSVIAEAYLQNQSGTNTGDQTTISGNAGTATLADEATILANTRNINGVAFNGSTNITIADATKLPLAGGTLTGAILIQQSGSTGLVTERTGGTGSFINLKDNAGSVFIGGVNSEFVVQTPGSSYSNKLTISSGGAATFSTNSNSSIVNHFTNSDTTNTSTRNTIELTAGNRFLQLQAYNADHIYFNRSSGSNLYFQSGGSTQMLISSGGAASFKSYISTNSASGASGAQGGITFNQSPQNSASRNWKIWNDDAAWGDFNIKVATAYNGSTYITPLNISSGGNATFTPSGGSVVIGSSGHITSTQALNAATAGGRFIGSSNRGVLGDIRIEQTTTDADGGYIRFMTSPSGSTSPTEKMRIQSDGDIKITGGGRILSSGGIYLGTNNNVNLLDDYEEGVFSPVYSSDNGTAITNLTAQTGNYVKVGKLVHISGSLRTQGSSSTSGVTGNLNISGLPFNSNAVRGHVTFWTHETAAAYNAPAQLPRASPVQSGAAKINIYKYSGSGGRTIRYLVSDLNMSGNSNFMHFSGTYEVN